MGRSPVGRLTVAEDRVLRLTEDTLGVIGGRREFVTKELRLVRYLGGLEQADRVELAEAQADVDEAIVRLRVTKGHLVEVEHRCAQKREIRTQIIRDFELEEREVEEAARTISVDAKAAGYRHTRPELTDCAPAEKATV